ncbi:MAG: polysaccharide lyase 6 family protein [Ferruginibacter sp.]
MKTIITPLLFCMLFQFSFATTYLETTPQQAVQRLVAAKAGDTVMLANGIYKDAVIKFSANGTKEYPVVFIAQTKGKVFFEGNSTLSIAGKYIIVDGFTWQNGGTGLNKQSVIEFKNSSDNVAFNCTLQNCMIDNYNNSDKAVDNKWVSVYGQNNIVSHCLLKAKDNLGATLTVWLKDGEAANHTIEYNYFLQRTNGANADNGLESMRIGDSKTSMTNAYCTIQFNRFEECDGEIEIISNKSCYNKYTGNTFYNCNGGLTLRHGNNCTVDGNYFFGVSKKRSYGIRVIGENHTVINNYLYGLQGGPFDKFRAPITLVNGLQNSPVNGYFQVKNAIIKNNFIINCNGPAVRIGSGKKEATLAPHDIIIQDNIVYNDSILLNELLMEVNPLATKIHYKNNQFYGRQPAETGWVKQLEDLLQKKGEIYINTSQIQKYTLQSAKQVGPEWMKNKKSNE